MSDPIPSGLRWDMTRPCSEQYRCRWAPSWYLVRDGHTLGSIRPTWPGSWEASTWRQGHLLPTVLLHGTLADCARALVEEVKRV